MGLAHVVLSFSAGLAPDPFTFPLLAAVVSTVALYLTAMILIAQRHDDELATRRDQLTLELAILSEQKSAKIIALLEEFRRNDPNQGDHRDEVAEAMAKPADTQVVLDAIKAAHDEPASAAGEKLELSRRERWRGGRLELGVAIAFAPRASFNSPIAYLRAATRGRPAR